MCAAKLATGQPVVNAVGEMVVTAPMPSMPLFVVVAEHTVIGDGLQATIKELIRSELSPRHVPDEVIVVTSLPRTKTGKRMEVPVKRILMGVDMDEAANIDSVNDAEALRQFVSLAARRSRASY